MRPSVRVIREIGEEIEIMVVIMRLDQSEPGQEGQEGRLCAGVRFHAAGAAFTKTIAIRNDNRAHAPAADEGKCSDDHSA